MKYSKQRALIYECVRENALHLTADGIYGMLKKDHPSLSLGTVYRNLAQLVEHRMIQKISTPGQPDRFDGLLENHFHLHCSECHGVQDLFVDELHDIDKLVEEKANVSIHSYEMSFTGVCDKCHSVN